MTLAFCFGASPEIAAFFIAYRFANLMRRLFGEGSLLSGFSPHFEEVRKVSTRVAAGFFCDLCGSLALLLIGTVGVVEGGLWLWAHVASPSHEVGQIISLTMWMLPGVVFICLYALFSALLQSEKRYFLPGAAPVMFNLVFIVATLLGAQYTGETAIFLLAGAVSLAFLMQWIAVIPATLQLLRRVLAPKELFRVTLFSPPVRRMAKAIVWTVLGVGAVQINGALDVLFARTAAPSGPAYLFYATRLYQLPLALFGISLSSALLPPLSRALQEGRMGEFTGLIRRSLTRCCQWMGPITVAILALGLSGVALVYGHGRFDALALEETTLALWMYGLGLIPAVSVLLLAPAFYARKDYRTPLVGSLISIGVNLVLNALFVFGMEWGPAAIAGATTVATAANAAALLYGLKKRFSLSEILPAWDEVRGSFTAAALAGVLTVILGTMVLGDASWSLMSGERGVAALMGTVEQMIHALLLGGVFAVTFLPYLWFLKVKGREEALPPPSDGLGE
jgi:putative peptidoglycan lipid II flippase